jgi:hypothetical protein
VVSDGQAESNKASAVIDVQYLEEIEEDEEDEATPQR